MIPLIEVRVPGVLLRGGRLQRARPRRRGRRRLRPGGAVHAHPDLRGLGQRGRSAKEEEEGRNADRAHFPG